MRSDIYILNKKAKDSSFPTENLIYCTHLSDLCHPVKVKLRYSPPSLLYKVFCNVLCITGNKQKSILILIQNINIIFTLKGFIINDWLEITGKNVTVGKMLQCNDPRMIIRFAILTFEIIHR